MDMFEFLASCKKLLVPKCSRSRRSRVLISLPEPIRACLAALHHSYKSVPSIIRKRVKLAAAELLNR